MASPFKDKTGRVFGYWTVLGFAGRDGRNVTVWNCKCICGIERKVVVGSLMQGKSKSCGCQQRKLTADKNRKHGLAGTPTYKSWHSMLQRSEGKGGHESYVERGLTVCERWMKFENFFEDMGFRPIGKTLDRIDNSKGYSKENCQWADSIQQANNRDTTKFVIVDGEKMPFMYACKKYNVTVSCARHRLRNGKTGQETFNPSA